MLMPKKKEIRTAYLKGDEKKKKSDYP